MSEKTKLRDGHSIQFNGENPLPEGSDLIAEAKARPTFPKLVTAMKAVDDGLINATDDDLREIATALFDKVDDYHYTITAFEDRAKRLGDEIKERQAKKKSLENRQARLEQLMTHYMLEKDFQTIPGNEYQVDLKRRKSIAWAENMSSPTPELYRKYPAFIRRKYEWNKTELTKAIKQGGDEFINQLGSLCDKARIEFTLRKEGKKWAI